VEVRVTKGLTHFCGAAQKGEIAMRLRSVPFSLVVVCALALLLALPLAAGANSLSPNEKLGKFLLFDTMLSTPQGQSCATCHAPEVGYTGPDSAINEMASVYPGAVHVRSGNRKPPTAAYGGDSPILYYDEDEEVWEGGMFWDGRATGWVLGDPLAEQAMGPFLNPLEQNNPNKRIVVFMVSISPYADLFETVWGEGSLDFKKNVDLSYEYIARSIAAYERSAEVNPFNSKFDAFWDATKAAGKDAAAINMSNMDDYKGYGLSDDEVYGLAVFNDEEKGMCGLCHTFEEGSAGYPLFTDFTFDNLGIPRYEDNPFYTMPSKWNPDGYEWTDPGLGGFLEGAGYPEDVYTAEWGKHKVPTLRNVDKRPYPEFVKAYGHNGFFKSLEEIVHFYNTRDVEMWPEPEVPETVNTDELGDLGLTADEEAAIVTFMATLSDR
jgi:cytochrome c peroxidase